MSFNTQTHSGLPDRGGSYSMIRAHVADLKRHYGGCDHEKKTKSISQRTKNFFFAHFKMQIFINGGLESSLSVIGF